MLYRASDSNGLGERVLSLPSRTPLATHAFQVHADAMCWLTNPITADVIENYHSTSIDADPLEAASSGWLAVVTRGSRTCFDLDGAGAGRALSLLGDPASGLCLLMRFDLAAPAYGWLASDTTGDVLGVLWTSAVPDVRPIALTAPSCGSTNGGVSLFSSSTPAGPTGLGTSLSPSGCKSRTADELEASAGAAFNSSLAASMSAVRLPTKRPPPEEQFSPGHSEDGCAKKAAVWGAPFAPTAAGAAGRDSVELAPPVQSGKAAWSPSSRPPSCATPSDETLVVALSCSPATKRRRESPADDSFTERNPAWEAPEPAAGTFSGPNLSKMVKESSLAWKLRDMADADKNFKAGSCSINAPAAIQARATLHEQGMANNHAGSSATGAPCAADPGNISKHADSAREDAFTTAPPPIVSISPTSSAPSSQDTPATVAARAPQRQLDGPSTEDDDDLLTASPLPVDVPVRLPQGPIGQLAADGSWAAVYERLLQLSTSTFVTGGPGVGKTYFLKQFAAYLRARWTTAGAVVVVAPTGSAARSAGGQTFHSFFGFVRDYEVQCDDPAAEAARLLGMSRWGPIARRLKDLRALLIDEVSMVPADKLDVMYELVRQSQKGSQSACLFYAFGDFLQLRPTRGSMAFAGKCWRPVFGTAALELTLVHRQNDDKLIRAIQDARWGWCSPKVEALMQERAVTEERYESLEHTVLHIMPRHEDVTEHNKKCLYRLSAGRPLPEFIATHTLVLDKNRDPNVLPCKKSCINRRASEAALLDCVAPARVPHCLQARVMLTTNRLDAIGLYHGSIGFIKAYLEDGVPVVRFENHPLPDGVTRGTYGVQGVGSDWIEVACPPMEYEARILSAPGWVAVRLQVPFVLGWGITAHRCQSLTMSEVVIEVARAFGAGMVHAAMSRVPSSATLHVKSFSAARLFADDSCMHFYRTLTLL